MRKFVVMVLILMIVCLLPLFSVACIEVRTYQANYDPSFYLSGNVENSIKYMPPLTNGVELEKIELADVLKNVTPLGTIKKLLILTHGSRSILINEQSIPFYYLSVDSKGIVRLDSTIDLHKTKGSYPIVSLSEIVVLTDVTSGIKRVFDDRTDTVDYITFLKAYGMLVNTGNATAEYKYDLTVFVYKTASIKKLLGSYDSAVLKFEDGSSLEVNSESTQIMNWSNGGLRLASDKYSVSESGSHRYAIVEIDYRSEKA